MDEPDLSEGVISTSASEEELVESASDVVPQVDYLRIKLAQKLRALPGDHISSMGRCFVEEVLREYEVVSLEMSERVLKESLRALAQTVYDALRCKVGDFRGSVRGTLTKLIEDVKNGDKLQVDLDVSHRSPEYWKQLRDMLETSINSTKAHYELACQNREINFKYEFKTNRLPCKFALKAYDDETLKTLESGIQGLKHALMKRERPKVEDVVRWHGQRLLEVYEGCVSHRAVSIEVFREPLTQALKDQVSELRELCLFIKLAADKEESASDLALRDSIRRLQTSLNSSWISGLMAQRFSAYLTTAEDGSECKWETTTIADLEALAPLAIKKASELFDVKLSINDIVDVHSIVPEALSPKTLMIMTEPLMMSGALGEHFFGGVLLIEEEFKRLRAKCGGEKILDEGRCALQQQIEGAGEAILAVIAKHCLSNNVSSLIEEVESEIKERCFSLALSASYFLEVVYPSTPLSAAGQSSFRTLLYNDLLIGLRAGLLTNEWLQQRLAERARKFANTTYELSELSELTLSALVRRVLEKTNECLTAVAGVRFNEVNILTRDAVPGLRCHVMEAVKSLIVAIVDEWEG